MVTYAFRCKNCGRLHTSDDAAEANHPHACCVCGSGVSFNPKTGVKTVDPENWEHLCEVPQKRLKELGLSKDQVEKHTCWKQHTEKEAFPKEPKHTHVSADDTVNTTDKT